MSKPRILVLMHYLELGGAEMSLIGLLQALDPEKVDVDLMLHSHRGELMDFVPEWVNVLPEVAAYDVIEKPLTEALRRRQWGVAFGRALARIRHRWYVHRHGPFDVQDASEFSYVAHCVAPFLPRIEQQTEYDLCLSFITPHDYGLKKVRARKRLAWIHTDYTNINVNRQLELPVWSGYDYIASISERVTETFGKTFPELKDKIVEIENILPAEFVRKRSQEYDASDRMQGTVKLLSIGRFTYPKNFDNVPDIMHRLVNEHGADAVWYIIGYGGDEALIRSKIAEAGMADRVVLLGKQANPYPFIRQCDVYVQPSRYEGKSVTVREAQMLCRPVAVTAYPTAASQVRHGYDGVIMPMDNAGCAEALADFIRNKELQQKITANLAIGDYGNTGEVDKIYSILDK